MSVLEIARLQFATTTIFHFLFVLVTLGLVTLLVAMQTAWAVTGRDKWLRHTRFWGRLYVINYFLGIATGVVLELQFGLTWAGLSHRLGNVFGTPLVIETLVAFVLESTFLGLWIFGFGRLPKWLHTALIWLVALTAYASVFWIMAANSFLQHPVGYEQGPDGVIRLADLGALVTNPTFVMALPHVISGAIMTGGFILAGISSWQLLRRSTDRAFFRTSLRLGVVVAFVGSFFTMGFGYAQFGFVTGQVQPTKFGDDAARQAAIAQFTERFGPGDYDPPAYFALSLGFMILIGTVLFLVGLFMLLFFKDLIIRLRVPLVLLLLALPLPFIAAILGWLTREGGRQPFAAYGLLPLEDALTPGLSAGSMMTGYVVFTAILAGLALTNWTLIARAAHTSAPKLTPPTPLPGTAALSPGNASLSPGAAALPSGNASASPGTASLSPGPAVSSPDAMPLSPATAPSPGTVPLSSGTASLPSAHGAAVDFGDHGHGHAHSAGNHAGSAAPGHAATAGVGTALRERGSARSGGRHTGSEHTTFSEDGEGLTWLSY